MEGDVSHILNVSPWATDGDGSSMTKKAEHHRLGLGGGDTE